MSTASTPTTSSTGNLRALSPDESDHIRFHGIRAFVDLHAPSLHGTVEAVAGPQGAELVEELIGALSEPWPDPALVTELVGRARDLLAGASFEQLDQTSRLKGQRHLHERVLWFGARLSDLAG